MKPKTCDTCGGDDFTVPETRMGGTRVPAVECAYCHMLDLDETTACSKDDLDSARMFLAAGVTTDAAASPANDDRDQGSSSRDG
jgi:hypothetical protein